MVTVTLREAIKAIEMAYAIKHSVIMMGSPGIGKTAAPKLVANKLGMGCKIYEASSLDPTDARGILIPDNNGSSYFTRSAILPDPQKDGNKGFLVIDELPSGLPAVQVALHPLFHPDERRLGTDKLADGWLPVATGNYASDGAGAYNLLTALSDRVMILNVVENFKEWKEDFALPNKIHPDVTGFLGFREDLFNTFEKRNKADKGKTWGSPRSHTLVSDIFYYDDKHSIGASILYASVAGYVGEGIAGEYVAWRNSKKDVPSPEDIIDKGKDLVPREPSLLYATCAAVVHYLRQTKLPKQEAIDRMLEYSLKMDAEFGMLMVRDAYVTFSNKITKSPIWKTQVAKRYF